eukprot:scaffold20690_cov130-Isochrysis_galbana.AAC.3
MLGGRERAAVGGMWRRDDDRHRHRARGALRTVAGGEGGKGDSVLIWRPVRQDRSEVSFEGRKSLTTASCRCVAALAFPTAHAVAD